MGKRVTVPVRVHPETRDDWHDHVDETPEWDSVSDLIRGAVSREIAGHYSPAGANHTAEVDLSSLEGKLDGMDALLRDIDDRVQRLEQVERDDKISDLAMAIRDMIPRLDDPDVLRDLEAGDTSMPTAELIQTYGSVDDIVSYFTDKEDVTDMQVRQAIDRLRDDLPATIETVTHEDERGSKQTRICLVD